ncbi:MAG: exosortase [candidate division Zixibacteria bacterium]|nr:exosortase [candidate division Zixibacteria bacterium]
MEPKSNTITADTSYRWSLIPLTGLIIVYIPALIDLVNDWWNDPNYSHGFLIPIVSATLIWQKRDVLKTLPRTSDWRGLVLLALAMIMFVVANGAAEYFTLRFSFVMALLGLTLYLFGSQVIRTTWFAFFFLLFMIPLPYVIYYAATFPMQALATKVAVDTLNVLGMNAIRQGNIIHVTGHTLEVAEACSGIRSLVSLLALGAIYAYSSQKRFTAKTLLFLSTIPIAVVGNVFRVLVTSIIVVMVSGQITEEPFHSIMGLLVFVVAFTLLFLFGAILRRVFK